MDNCGIAYEDLDIKGDGTEAFRKFYGANRSSIHRGEKGIGDRIGMDVKGPVGLYPTLLDEAVDPGEIEKSISLVAWFPEYEFYTTIAPVIRQPGENPEISFLTPEEIKETAKLIEDATGSKKHLCELRGFDPGTCEDERLESIAPLSSNEMFKYHTAARRSMVMTEIEK